MAVQSTVLQPSLTLKRRLKAPPAKVFAAWTDPDKVKGWMGPGEVKVLKVECDPRVGGRYRWLMQSPDGQEHDVSGVYREFVPNQKLVFTWAWKTTPERESLVTVEIKPDGYGSMLTLTSAGGTGTPIIVSTTPMPVGMVIRGPSATSPAPPRAARRARRWRAACRTGAGPGRAPARAWPDPP